MGVSANQSRLMTLTARMHDLELRAQQISNQKVTMSLQSEAIALAYSNDMRDATDTNTGEVNTAKLNSAQATYEQGTAALVSKEKLLDLELSQINTEHQAATTEYDSVKSLISDNVEKSFSLFG